MDIKSLAEQYNDYIIDRRRYYHTCPELSGEEKNTRAHLKEDLEALGITDIHEMETCYGLTATIHGGKPGKTVALRADIDALPVKEETGLPFASHNEGKMHACGHDNHMAMLLGTAKILNEVKDELSGDVRLVFQPAEETAVGALQMMKEHALDGVDAIYGVHVWGTYDAPGIAFPAGNLMACCHGFTIEVEGKSAHASAPHEGVDAVMVASSILQSIQQLVSRMNDPLNPLVITVGKVTAGNRWNVLAGHATLEGTVRTFLTGTQVEDALRHPNWTMGRKITIDSSTLVNKGLEVMEAKWLFDVELEQIEVVVHPQSVIHSAVQYEDGAAIAQLGTPDMRLPIQYALYYPKRRPLSGDRLDLFALGQLTFERPDTETFRGLALAYQAMRRGGNIPTAFNAANEKAVALFLDRNIAYQQIPEMIESCMEAADFIANPTVDEILETEAAAYEHIAGKWGKVFA